MFKLNGKKISEVVIWFAANKHTKNDKRIRIKFVKKKITFRLPLSEISTNIIKYLLKNIFHYFSIMSNFPLSWCNRQKCLSKLLLFIRTHHKWILHYSLVVSLAVSLPRKKMRKSQFSRALNHTQFRWRFQNYSHAQSQLMLPHTNSALFRSQNFFFWLTNFNSWKNQTHKKPLHMYLLQWV